MSNESPRSGVVSSFNGGKMNHIWTPGRGCYESTFASEAAERCFCNPNTIISLKVHGECALLIKTPLFIIDDVTTTTTVMDDTTKQEQQAPAAAAPSLLYEWTFATRYDARGNKDPPRDAIPLPVDDSPHPAVYQDHYYWLIPLDKNLVSGKGKRKTLVGQETYGAIAAGVASGAIPDPNDPQAPDYISVEWIGRKHQGNIDQVTQADHAICVHGNVILNHLLPLPRSRRQVEQLATTCSIEGLVLYDPDSNNNNGGERFKIRFDMFPNSAFAKNCNSPVTMETTCIKPKAIVAAAAAGDVGDVGLVVVE